MERWKISRETIILIALSSIFFGVYAWFSFGVINKEAANYDGQKIFSWPDAMANYHFVEEFYKTGRFESFEPLNSSLGNIVHPRSINVFNGHLVPLGFLGMILVYGLIAKLIGLNLIMYLTPLLAVIGVLFFYGIIKRVFNDKTALYAAVFLFVLPAYVYYANLGLLSAILFIFFILGALYFAIKAIESNFKYVLYSLSGLFLGLALITRVNEIILLAIIVGLPLIYYFRRIGWRSFMLALVFFLLPILTMMYFNNQLYGGYFNFGYMQIGEGNALDRLSSEFQIGGPNIVVKYLQILFLPFGLHLKTLLINVFRYLVLLHWPYLLLSVFGLSAFFLNWRNRRILEKQKVFFVVSVVVCVWLVWYYGNWRFEDLLVLKNNTIGSSYARYWLLIYITTIPFMAYLFNFISEYHMYRLWRRAFVILSIIGILVFNIYITFLTPGDGLLAQAKTTHRSYGQLGLIEKVIDPGALIICDRADKILFPKYKVIAFNLDYGIFSKIKPIVGQKPIYYLTVMPDRDIEYINEKKIKEFGLVFSFYKQIDGEYRVFELKNIVPGEKDLKN